jgi:hypothetical protein
MVLYQFTCAIFSTVKEIVGVYTFKCKILRKWQILGNFVSKSVPIRITFSGFIHFVFRLG